MWPNFDKLVSTSLAVDGSGAAECVSHPRGAAVSPQGVLYVFGGLLDSAYTRPTSPLWLYHVGEPASQPASQGALVFPAAVGLSVWLHAAAGESECHGALPL